MKLACLNPLKAKLICVIYENSIRTSEKTIHVTIARTSRLTLYREITVYSYDLMKRINVFCGQNGVGWGVGAVQVTVRRPPYFEVSCTTRVTSVLELINIFIIWQQQILQLCSLSNG